MSKPDYGDLYFCVETPTERIHMFADLTEITSNGDLILRRKDDALMFAFAKGTWTTINAASCLDGSAVSVEHWGKRNEE